MNRGRGDDELEFVAAELSLAERRIALLDACVPLNGRQERMRVLDAWQKGQHTSPRWVLPQVVSLAPIRRALDAWIARLPSVHPLGPLYAARAEELSLEAALVEARGERSFSTLAARRYPLSAEEIREAEEVSCRWLAAVSHAAVSHGSLSSERRPVDDLVVALRRRIDELGLQARIELRSELASIAAVGEGVVFVCSSAELDDAQIERIVLHEIEGHLLPRAVARQERWGIFRVGSAGAGEDEEGRALWLEESHGFLGEETPNGVRRRRELALRHRVAVAVRQGADFVEQMRWLLAEGERLTDAYRICERALRGGGLGRELCYLPALARVRAAFRERPELEGWMRRGRISLAVARWFEDAQGSLLST